MRTSDQFVEDDAERKNVRRGCERLASNLFGLE